ncbi:helix-turn-helix domain-containing protein [Hymenobacter volaticus]|uniref:Helix-turn-helix domain-containing protein n=1 Tax=Hymenobacter volaticus TaxID=2932254 RepID=A0ABY4GF32_9BACT|nr:helix-turn-helix domain-containing protein [Hymenobacter volaticus]UOQ69443.1 helix-turn-helix domain-containing protein [Hymenobacter volaticus]
MDLSQSLADFHRAHLLPSANLPRRALDNHQFFVYSSEQTGPQLLPYQRRDFYKITLLTAGTGQLHYASRSLQVNQPALVFTNPLVPYAWEKEAGSQGALYCSFTNAFWQGGGGTNPALASLPLFQPGGDPVFLLESDQVASLAGIFQHLWDEAGTDYLHKVDVLRHYVQLLLHEARKLQPPTTYAAPTDGNGRITSLFLELLEQQFPLENPEQKLRLRTPQDYAAALAVHVNYLNRAVRHVTGRTTTALLAGRLVREAITLLHYSTWPVATISDALGFAYPTYFNTFYKKHTGHTPRQARQTLV